MRNVKTCVRPREQRLRARAGFRRGVPLQNNHRQDDASTGFRMKGRGTKGR